MGTKNTMPQLASFFKKTGKNGNSEGDVVLKLETVTMIFCFFKK